MAHTTGGGVAFLRANPSFVGEIGGHSIGPAAFPQFTLGDIIPTAVDLLFGDDCPTGQIKVAGRCIDIGIAIPGGNGASTLCAPGFVLDSGGNCVPGSTTDITPGVDTPAERGARADGPALPSRVARNVHVCPKFVDGSTGILYFSPLTNEIVCLPRSMTTKSAMAFGLLRKNKPRAKAAVTAADVRLLNKVSSVQNRIGSLAAKADGLSCPPKKKVGSTLITSRKASASKGRFHFKGKHFTRAQARAGFAGPANKKRAGG